MIPELMPENIKKKLFLLIPAYFSKEKKCKSLHKPFKFQYFQYKILF